MRTPRPRRVLALLLASVLVLQAYFALRVAIWTVLPVYSTTFMRDAQLRLMRTGGGRWQHDWRPYERISPWLARSVVASEDDSFMDNDGVDWDAIRAAWTYDQRARARRKARVRGGSTITQQLAKNLFLSPERSYVRKAQELVIVGMLDVLLGKRRIMEIYLNSVEWGDATYGAQAASRRYFRIDASRLGQYQSARLAVMLPAPHYFQDHLHGHYLNARTALIAGRATQAAIPRQ